MCIKKKETNPPVHWGRAGPYQYWLLDVPAALKPAAGALYTLLCAEPRSHHKGEQLCSTALGEHRLEHLGSFGGCLRGHKLPAPELHTFEKALIDYGLMFG